MKFSLNLYNFVSSLKLGHFCPEVKIQKTLLPDILPGIEVWVLRILRMSVILVFVAVAAPAPVP